MMMEGLMGGGSKEDREWAWRELRAGEGRREGAQVSLPGKLSLIGTASLAPLEVLKKTEVRGLLSVEDML